MEASLKNKSFVFLGLLIVLVFVGTVLAGNFSVTTNAPTVNIRNRSSKYFCKYYCN